MHSSVTRTSRRLSASTSPTKNVALVSPCTPLEEDGDVEVDDVAVLQRPGVGDAVADDLVDRRADALGEAVVVERARVGAALDGEVVDEDVDLVGGDAGRAPARRRGAGPRRPAAPARRIRSMSSGDLTSGSFQRGGMPVSAYGGRAMAAGHAAHRADLAGDDPALERLVAPLVLAPAPAPAQVVRAQGHGGGRHRSPGYWLGAHRRPPGPARAGPGPAGGHHSPWWPMPHPQWSRRPEDQRSWARGRWARWQTVRSAVLSLTQRGGRRTTFGATFPMRRSSFTY